MICKYTNGYCSHDDERSCKDCGRTCAHTIPEREIANCESFSVCQDLDDVTREVSYQIDSLCDHSKNKEEVCENLMNIFKSNVNLLKGE